MKPGWASRILEPKHIRLRIITKGMEVLRSMKLTSIDGLPAEQFWKKWDAPKAKAK